ncbi:hypothetical protein L9F63_015718, partial [Diploptera punctata]
QQLKATFVISPSTQITRGVLRLRIYHTNTFTDFIVNLWLDYGVRGSREMFVVAAAEPGSVNAEHTSNLEAKITFIPSQQLLDTEEPHLLILTFISISDHYGNR